MHVTYRSLKTRFRYAYTYRLKLATYTKGVLFTFPSRYLFTIGQSVVLSLGEWSPHFQTEFLVLRPTQEYCGFLLVRDYHPL